MLAHVTILARVSEPTVETMRALIASGERVVLIVEPTVYEREPRRLPIATGSLVNVLEASGS